MSSELSAPIAFHLVPEAWYRAQPLDAPYLPEPFAQDGFVHLTHGEQAVLDTGNRYYRTVPGRFLLLTVDLASLAGAVRYDDPARQYPHVYGPLERAAIVAVRVVERDAAGAFVAIGGPA